MIDPEHKYCPQCHDEYLASIETCAACEVTLLSGHALLARRQAAEARKARRAGTISPDDDIVLIRRGGLNDLRSFEALLLEENIVCLLTGDQQACGKGCCAPTLDLKVRREDAGDAIRIIEDEIRRTSVFGEDYDPELVDQVFDPEAAESVCPACGHKFRTCDECPECGLCF